MGFTYDFSSNGLTLSDDGFDNADYTVISNTKASSLLSGTYRRSSFTEPGGNPPIGSWKFVGSDGVQIFRFFKGGFGSVYTFVPEGNYVGFFKYGENQLTFSTGETLSFAFNGNSLVINRNEYKKR